MNAIQIENHMKQVYYSLKDDHVNILGVPEGATHRLCQIKLLQIELKTRDRLESTDRIDRLKLKLKQEEENFSRLEQLIDQHGKGKLEREQKMSQYLREIDYFKKKSKEYEKNTVLEEKEYNEFKTVLNRLTDELEQLTEALREFKNLEPTNECLKSKIDDMKKSRISLSELTLIEED